MPTDVHQHLWPPGFIALLRARATPPRLAGWTLHLPGEPPYDVDPADHDIASRVRLARADGLDLALVSLSSPLGIEYLPPEEAAPLLTAFHDGVLALPAPFRVWASPCLSAPEPDPEALRRELTRGCVGLQLPATALLDAEGRAHCAPLLDVAARMDRPLFVHPGAAPSASGGAPVWWPALVPYVQQLHASWFAFRAFGRPRHPGQRVCFAALAGLAPLHGERLMARGGGRDRGRVDCDAFYETSSYGTRAVDALVRAVGIDVVVTGSDRPYAAPAIPDLGADAAVHALRTANPARLLGPMKGAGS
ncbi:amidohydrolase family protein [Streptomyces halobius]|uniref:Amidohydrolase n=1 Tax=Streptomyces halobius TaxID=2879846 RepID=A0ABY4MD67_9ACTN|nr:amidohydrolase family protein [Streptomyces halobius]UQA95053.1 amidohydrolase [Streptomyces halobius]